MSGNKNISQLAAKLSAFHPNDLMILRDFQSNRDLRVTYAQLLVALGSGNGLSAYQVAVAEGYTGTVTEWLDSLTGSSAYDIAVANGFEGTEEEWIASLKGEDGDPGDSAYAVAVANGFVGTAAEWLASLKGDEGDPGDSAYEIAVANGFVGTAAEWLASLEGQDGDPGDSAYAVAVANGFVGTEAQWIESLKGDEGDPGDSAYAVAVANGFVGTEVEWLASLEGDEGDPGASAYEIAVANGFVGTEAEWLESLEGEDGGITGFPASDNKVYGIRNQVAEEIKSVMKTYANLTAMIADQAAQRAGWQYYDGKFYYEYLGTTLGTSADYRRLFVPEYAAATHRESNTVLFDNDYVTGINVSARSGNILFDFTGAQLVACTVMRHQDASAFTFPAEADLMFATADISTTVANYFMFSIVKIDSPQIVHVFHAIEGGV
jgi:hypothetical protein